jgi:hypothetical protein
MVHLKERRKPVTANVIESSASMVRLLDHPDRASVPSMMEEKPDMPALRP